MSHYQLAAQTLERSAPEFSDALAHAYQAKVRPLCLCISAGVPMYIAKLGDKYVLKRMPNSGTQHDVECDSFESPPGLSGRGHAEEGAMKEDQETGMTHLRLDFSLTKSTSHRAAPSGDAKAKTEVKAEPVKLSIRALLHCLYEDAQLNKWSPGMAGKRNWYIVRKYLLEAAQSKAAKKSSLADRLLIPESFRSTEKERQSLERKHFLAQLKTQGTTQPLGLLVGEVKAFEPARFGYKMIIKHMPETPIFMGDTVHKHIEKHFARELAFFAENETIHLLTVCTFCLSATGAPQVETISFMLVDHNWLPFETQEELVLQDKLVHERRSFIKMLRYNLQPNAVIASYLLTDTLPPTVCFINPMERDENYDAELNAIIEGSELPTLIWEGEATAIPPKAESHATGKSLSGDVPVPGI